MAPLRIVVTHFVTVLSGELQNLQRGPSLQCRGGVTLGHSVHLAKITRRGIATGWQCGTSRQWMLGDREGRTGDHEMTRGTHNTWGRWAPWAKQGITTVLSTS